MNDLDRSGIVPAEQIDRLLSFVLANRWNRIILDRARAFGMEDWWLTAGCISQSVWNGLYGRSPDYGILDYDIFYFDPDTSWEAEDRVIGKVAVAFADLPVAVQIRNQARVPLWYEEKFGVAFPPVARASDGIDRFPCATVSVGVRRNGDDFKVHASFGLDLLLRGKLVPNITLKVPAVYAEKTARWTRAWPELVVAPWPSSSWKASFKSLGLL